MSESYYGRPIVKPHVWTPMVPLYFWIGGTAGAAAVHAAISRRTGNVALANVQRHVALAGAALAPVLLIADLGVPQRFLNMLRVFKPTSPMSVGSWVLSVFGTCIGAATGAELLGWNAAADGLEVAAGALGPLLTTYTAVLVADTATPTWHAAYPTLPFVFVASGIAGAGAAASAFTPPEHAAPARRMMIGGALALVATEHLMERQIGELLSEPYRTGRAKTLKTVSIACALGGAIAGIAGQNNVALTRVAAAAVAAAGILERFVVFAAGKQSAADPKYVVEPQRERLAAR